MKKIILFLVFVSTISALYANSFKEWDKIFKNLSNQQRSSLVKTFVKSLPLNYQFSMTAIHLKESHGGKYNYNINNGTSIDVGDFMINTKEYNRKRGLKNNTWNTARAMEQLSDYDTNYLEALTIFKECLKASKGDWKKAYRYYNGWKSGSKESYDYAQDIIVIQKVLKKYFNLPQHQEDLSSNKE